MKLSIDQVRWLRMRAQRLIGPPEDTENSPERVLEAVTGLQAQDLPSALLGLRVRSRGLTETKTQAALQTPGRLAVAWTLRGTLHLHSAADATWLLPLLGPTFIAADRRRMNELGWDEATAVRGLDLLRKALSQEQELTRPEIIRQLDQAGLPAEGQAPIHLIARAALEGWLCQGPRRGRDETYTLSERWIGSLQWLPRRQALGRLARRYLAAYGPANSQDFASWVKLKAADIRLGWEQLAADTIEIEANGETLWLFKDQLDWLDGWAGIKAEPVVRLLPRFDALLLGYASRDWLVDPAYARQVHPGGGMLRATLLVDGRLAGIWKTRSLKGGLRVEVAPFEPLPERALAALEGEAADLGRFLGQEAEAVILTSD